MTRRLGMIWAEARNGAIGREGVMPWHLPEDLAHFKHVTLGSPVIMGRRTWESLPEPFRPLPGRVNVVVTRENGCKAEGAVVVGSLAEALSVEPAHDAWIIGGGQLYRAAMPFATELVVTRIKLDVAGADTFAPSIGREWTLVDAGQPLVSAAGVDYCFERWMRRA